MARRNAVRLGIPALIVAILALVALWRIGAPATDGGIVGVAGSRAHDDIPTMTAVAELLTKNAIGRQASLHTIEVREVTSGRTFWAGDSDAERVFVVLDPDVKRDPAAQIDSGARVTLIGLVRPAPPIDQAMRQWNVDRATAGSVADHGTYLYCTEVKAGG